MEKVLEFWFGEPATDTATLGAKVKRWYDGGPAVDAEIRDNFTPLVEQALAGELDAWADTPRGRLALILVLDQFPRAIFRDDPRTYAGDPRAQQLAIEAADRGLTQKLDLEPRLFSIMPFVHAEDLALQERGVVEMTALYEASTPWQQAVVEQGLEQSKKYRDIIARFGRFPHRNTILGRTSTDEEKAFLVDWEARRRPQGAQR